MSNLPDGTRRPVRTPRPDGRAVAGDPVDATRRRRPAAHPFTIGDRARRLARGGLASPEVRALVRAIPGGRGERRIAPGRIGAVTVVALVLLASVVSVAPASGSRPSAGTSSAGSRIVVGGGILGAGPAADPSPAEAPAFVPVLAVPVTADDEAGNGAPPRRVSPDPRVEAWYAHLAGYTVKAGDTLYTIASRNRLSLRTVMWANDLTGKLLHVGQKLVLPSADAVVVTVGAGDTLASIARKLGVSAAAIAGANQLIDGDVVPGQTLFIQGGATLGTRAAASGPAASRTSRTAAPKPRPAVARFAWPVPGGHLSQRFGCTGLAVEPPYGSCRHFHAGMDIAAPAGTPIVAAAAGTVAYAGWASNGGGYQVWISFRPGVYTLYAHMSSVAVHGGQHVGRGQRIGRVGMSGNATGPHCHFEVWVGQLMGSGHPVNPAGYM